uniref:Uncharacterized protein n=1 Tax=Plectus sambesii TaxID=2011161 RepID=A0A914UPR8_9BILA
MFSAQPLVDAVTYQMMQMSTIGQQPTQSVYGSPQALRPSSMPSQSMPMLQAMSQPPAADYAPRRLQYPLGQVGGVRAAIIADTCVDCRHSRRFMTHCVWALRNFSLKTLLTWSNRDVAKFPSRLCAVPFSPSRAPPLNHPRPCRRLFGCLFICAQSIAIYLRVQIAGATRESPSFAAFVCVRRATQNSLNGMASGGVDRNVQFSAIARIEDSQAIRAVAFHPSGRYFAVGTNSKQMHVLKYPDIRKIIPGDSPRAAEVLLSRPKQHRGSVYCVGFNPTGELLATGSNDKTIRLMGFNADSCKIGAEVELTMHDGTVRDLVFMEDTVSRTSLLISGGAGNCHIHLTDCATGQTFKSLAGHTAPILGLYTWGGCMFVSCSQDKTIRFWDLRCAQAVNLIAPGSKTASAPVTSVCVDPGGKLLVSGHEDASVMLYDVTGSKVVQIFRPHGDEVRTVRFSPGTYYLLSGSYDKKIAITDMRGDLMAPLMYLPVAEHNDKVIQC